MASIPVFLLRILKAQRFYFGDIPESADDDASVPLAKQLEDLFRHTDPYFPLINSLLLDAGFTNFSDEMNKIKASLNSAPADARNIRQQLLAIIQRAQIPLDTDNVSPQKFLDGGVYYLFFFVSLTTYLSFGLISLQMLKN